VVPHAPVLVAVVLASMEISDCAKDGKNKIIKKSFTLNTLDSIEVEAFLEMGS
jgi:hypothetical protein